MQLSGRGAYIAAALTLVVVVAIVNLTVPIATAFPTSDAWAHVAALNEWSGDLGDPGHSHLPVDAPSARFIPPYLPIAAATALFDLSAVTAFAISAIAAALLLVVVLYRFFRMLIPGEPLAPLLGLGAMLFVWGLALPWSGLFELRSFVAVVGYPSAWSFGLGLTMVMAAVHAARRSRPAWLIITGLLSAAVLLSHPITAVFVYGLAVVIAIDQGWRRFVAPGIAALFGIAAAFLWPFFSLADVITSPLVVADGGRLLDQFYDPLRVLAMVAPALVGLYALYRLEARRRVALASGAAAMAALWLGNIFVEVPVGDRFLVFTVFYLHVALVVWLAPLLGTIPRTAGTWLRIGGGVLIAGHILILVVAIGGRQIEIDEISTLANRGDIDIVAQMEELTKGVSDDAVVMADTTTRWMLPAFRGKVTSTDRDYFGVDGIAERLADADEFFSAEMSQERRHALLSEYAASFVAFAPEEVGAAVTAELKAMGEVVVETRFFTLVSPAP